MPAIPSLPTSLFPCLFRFIPFEAAEITRETGRRLVTHIYPNRDQPFHEDLGRKTRRWKIQGFVIGESADLIRDLMIDAVEKEGPAPLIHFKLGLVYVRCESLEVRESVEGGINVCEFVFDFVESGDYFKIGILSSAAALAKTAVVGAAMGIVWATSASPQPADLSALASSLSVVAGHLSDTDSSTATAEALADIAAAADALAVDPDGLIAAINAALATVTVSADLRTLTDQAFAALTASGGAALDVLMCVLTLTAAASAAVEETFSTWDDAVAVRDHLGDQFSVIEMYLTDADLYAGIVDLKGFTIQAISTEAVTLPRLRSLSVTYAVPAVVLAYNLYGDAGRATEILERNSLSDPSHVVGDLRVLST